MKWFKSLIEYAGWFVCGRGRFENLIKQPVKQGAIFRGVSSTAGEHSVVIAGARICLDIPFNGTGNVGPYHGGVGAASNVNHRRVVIVTKPYTDGIIRREANEPGVARLLTGTGFSGNGEG